MRISIITVTYNAEATVERTLESVAQQTYPDVEHLIIDGASTDRTLEIAKKYPHAIIISEPDKGLYDAMNKGLQRATGEAWNATLIWIIRKSLPLSAFSMATLTLLMHKGSSFAIVVSHLLSTSLGVHSKMVCWFAIRHSTLTVISPCPTTCSIVSQQTLTGVFAV